MLNLDTEWGSELHALAVLPQGKRPAVPNYFMGPRAVPDAVKKRKISPLPVTKPGFPARPVRSVGYLGSRCKEGNS
jgi:hypothetical protein